MSTTIGDTGGMQHSKQLKLIVELRAPPGAHPAEARGVPEDPRALLRAGYRGQRLGQALVGPERARRAEGDHAGMPSGAPRPLPGAGRGRGLRSRLRAPGCVTWAVSTPAIASRTRKLAAAHPSRHHQGSHLPWRPAGGHLVRGRSGSATRCSRCWDCFKPNKGVQPLANISTVSACAGEIHQCGERTTWPAQTPRVPRLRSLPV
jgi:hypothetical protein